MYWGYIVFFAASCFIIIIHFSGLIGRSSVIINRHGGRSTHLNQTREKERETKLIISFLEIPTPCPFKGEGVTV